jgi:hypothetical protein
MLMDMTNNTWMLGYVVTSKVYRRLALVYMASFVCLHEHAICITFHVPQNSMFYI